MPIARLDRTVLSLSGDGVNEWLDGLITNSLTQDITFAALLTPQGKIIADFFVTKHSGRLLLDMPSKFEADVTKRLKMYRLRAKIAIENISDHLSIYAAWDGTGDEGYQDPRHEALGQRIVSEHIDTTATQEDYNAHRLSLGVPDSHWDFETVSTFPADMNMDLLNGVDYKKGCFVGQEVVSRMHRKGTIRKRSRGFESAATADAGDSLKVGDSTVGQVYSKQGRRGIALIRLDRIGENWDAITLNGKPARIFPE